MNTERNVIPFVRLVPKQAQAQREAQRHAAILSSPEAQGVMMGAAMYLADKTTLTVLEVIAALAVSSREYNKAQADALSATVAKRKIQERCIDILTSPAASHDSKLATWLALETTVAASVAIEVMARAHAAENANA